MGSMWGETQREYWEGLWVLQRVTGIWGGREYGYKKLCYAAVNWHLRQTQCVHLWCPCSGSRHPGSQLMLSLGLRQHGERQQKHTLLHLSALPHFLHTCTHACAGRENVELRRRKRLLSPVPQTIGTNTLPFQRSQYTMACSTDRQCGHQNRTQLQAT